MAAPGRGSRSAIAICLARLGNAINAAELARAREWPNPEATVELENEAPKQALGLSLPLELGGKRAKRTAVGKATVRAGAAEVAATIAQVRDDVRRAYFGVHVAEARLELMEEVREIAVRVRNAARQRFDAGDAPRLEVLQAELALATAENEAAGSAGSAIAARAELNVLLDWPPGATPTLSSPIDSSTPTTPDAALALARDANTELQLLDRQVETQEARVALAGALRAPDLVPSATLTHDAAPEFDYGWRAGLALELPIFTSHRAGLLVEQSTLDQLTSRRQALLALIEARVAAASVLEAHRRLYLRYRDDIVPQAEQVEQLAQDSYRLGQTGIAPLLQASQASRDVRLRVIDAVAQFQNSLADLEKAIGVPLP